jgi:hypothetical protein
MADRKGHRVNPAPPATEYHIDPPPLPVPLPEPLDSEKKPVQPSRSNPETEYALAVSVRSPSQLDLERLLQTIE